MKKQYMYITENTTYLLTIDFTLISEARYSYYYKLFKNGILYEL